jgi:hypothetical protein
MLITHDDEGAEIKPASALDNFGGTIDEYHFLDQLLAGFRVKRGFRLGPAATSAILPASTAATTTTAESPAAAATTTAPAAGSAAAPTAGSTAAPTAGSTAAPTSSTTAGTRFNAAFYFCWFSHNIPSYL